MLKTLNLVRWGSFKNPSHFIEPFEVKGLSKESLKL